MRRASLAAAAAAAAIGVLPTGTTSTATQTADPPFGAPHRIDDASTVVGGYNAAVDVDSVGDAVAVWQSDGIIYGSRRPVGGGWSAPTQLLTTYISEPDVIALRDDGSAFLDYGANSPEGDAIAIWYPNNTVLETDVSGQYADAKVAADLDDDLLAYVESANGRTRYHFAAPGTDPVGDGWTSVTRLRSFGASRVAFGARHTYYVAYPPDPAGTDHQFRVNLIHGLTGQRSLVLRHRLCPRAGHSRLAGYDLGAGPSGSALLAWRCTSRAADVIDAQRIRPGGKVGPVVEIARSRRPHVKDRLSEPAVAVGPASPTVIFSRAKSGRRRSLVAVSPDPSGGWRPTYVVAPGVEARSAKALGARLDWSATGAALLTYRSGGFHGAIWAVRRMAGGAFGAPVRIFPSALIRPAAVAGNGSALVSRVTSLDGRFVARFAPGA